MALAIRALTLAVLAVTMPGLQSEDDLQAKMSALQEQLDSMEKLLKDLARQTMLQQYSFEERIRSDGDSGVKTTRGNNKGPENYYSSTHITDNSVMSMHDHSNFRRTMGMGEIIAVLNGVEFQTRHNDYQLVMHSTTSTNYHETEPLPFPDVPEEVTQLNNTEDQVEEMRKWFKAFKDQDHSVRDYRKYFKAALCYLEGTWTLDEDLEEPFHSETHQLDASSWFELQEHVRYASYTGTKSRLENFAFLPTTIMSVNETTGVPNYAQWNYRILCNPVKEDLPTRVLRQAKDLSFSYPKKKSSEDILYSRAARFKVYEETSPTYTKYSLLDRIMADIPGKDNIPGELREDSFGETMFKFDEDVELNVGFYHRWLKFSKPGAMGLTTVARGFNDENLWVAKTTQNRVAPMDLTVCQKKDECRSFKSRFSFAIPLEIVYLTPLLSWNPYNLYEHEGNGGATKGDVERNGNEDNPLNGTDRSHHYLTPVQFFSGEVDTSDPADTVKDSNYVFDQEGNKRLTTASGTKIILQEIEGVGEIRLRYPIAPVHGEGSSVWKELNALRDDFFQYRLSGGGGGGGGDDTQDSSELPEVLDVQTSSAKEPFDHFHTFTIPRETYLSLIRHPTMELTVTTSEAAGHTHDLRIRFHYKRGFEYKRCDGTRMCWDQHPVKLIITNGP